MEDFFNMIANVLDIDLSGMYESSLSTDMIEESIARACDFFHIEQPTEIESGYTTAVGLGDTSTYQDDILFYNRAQLEEMGITGQDGLDLVMTHEGTHRVLQSLDTGFDSYQEELCCDYMVGVRAGLNGMDVSQLEDSLRDNPQGLGHPVGTLRVDAIEQGMAFAQEYMASHTLPPTFNECLEDFKGENMHEVAELARLKNDLYAKECTMEHYQRLMEREPDNELAKEKYNESKIAFKELHDDYSKKVSFMGRYEDIDRLYDPDIKRSIDVLKNDLDKIAKGKIDLSEAKRTITRDQQKIDYWKDAKIEAERDADKNQIFSDYIKGQMDIIEKYRKK